MTEIVISAAKRTPVGSFNGAFATVPAHELGRGRGQMLECEARGSADSVNAPEFPESDSGRVRGVRPSEKPSSSN